MLIVEDGTGLTNAESYVSVVEIDDYFAKLGYTVWQTLTEPEKEQAIRRAMRYMRQVYHGYWRGVPATTTQALDWPRDRVPGELYGTYYPNNAVPMDVKEAQMLLSIKAAAGELAPDLDTAGGVLEETVGPITIKYDKPTRDLPRYTNVEMTLRSFILSGSGKVVRA